MPTRKRVRAEMEAAEPPAPEPTSLLTQIRNKWEFANLMQYIYLFGEAVKIDPEIDAEELESELLTTEPSPKLAEIGLCLLKFVSSHRGLTLDMFDEYTRRQYQAKAPHRNPFGEEEESKQFLDLDVFAKLRVLWQLSQWTLNNPDRIRERMPEGENETLWRMEELGYDRERRLYYVLDDNRLYRRTDAPTVAPAKKPKANSKAGKALARANKRRRTSARGAAAAEEEKENAEQAQEDEEEEDLFGGMQWECLAVSLLDYQNFMEPLKKSKDDDERQLCKRLVKDVMPVLEEAEERRQERIRRKEKELLLQEKMSRAKRSSRLADKQEKEREAAEAEASERRRKQELAEARRTMDKQKQIEEDRQSRMLTREQRIKEREAKKLLEEQELKELSEAQEKGQARISERNVKVSMERKRKAIEELEAEESWTFDCSGCGTYGENLDDGSHSVSCERCYVWQHSKCLGISEEEAEENDFHLVCAHCKRREEDAKKPKIPPLRLKASVTPPSNKNKKIRLPSDSIEVQVPNNIFPTATPASTGNSFITNGHSSPNHLQSSPSGSTIVVAPYNQHAYVDSIASQVPTPTISHPSASTSSTAPAAVTSSLVPQAGPAFTNGAAPNTNLPHPISPHSANGTALPPSASLNSTTQRTPPAKAALPPIGSFAPLSHTKPHHPHPHPPHHAASAAPASTSKHTISPPRPAVPPPTAYKSPWAQQAEGNGLLGQEEPRVPSSPPPAPQPPHATLQNGMSGSVGE